MNEMRRKEERKERRTERRKRGGKGEKEKVKVITKI
jgi:hypothetical protein